MFFFSGDNKKLQSLDCESPVVVMSRGHSGTRILSVVLDHLGVHMGTTLENPAADTQDLRLTKLIKKLGQKHLHEEPLAPAQQNDLLRFKKQVLKYKDWLGNELEHGWGWKFPETYLIFNYVNSALPKAKYIHMLRDGRDIAFKEHSTDRPNRRIGKTLLKHIGALKKPPHIRAALSWEFQVNRFDAMTSPIRNSMITIRFEELIQKPIFTAIRISEFLKLELTQTCRDYLENKLDQTRLSQYKKEDPVKVAEVEKIIGPTLEKFGYVT